MQVTFSYGTTYRDKCNITMPGYMKYTIQLDKDGIRQVVEAPMQRTIRRLPEINCFSDGAQIHQGQKIPCSITVGIDNYRLVLI